MRNANANEDGGSRMEDGKGHANGAPSSILHLPSSKNWLTVAEAAHELGFAPDTIREHLEELGATRLGRGPWRIPRAKLEHLKAHPEILSQPRATLQELHQTVQRVNLLSAERELTVEQKLKAFERRLADLEKRLMKQLLAP